MAAAKKSTPSAKMDGDIGTSGTKRRMKAPSATGKDPAKPSEKTSPKRGAAKVAKTSQTGKASSKTTTPKISKESVLVIVESPTKSKTLTKILGPGYTVRASVGHVRDLPKSRMAIDIDHDFAPEYILVKGKATLRKELAAIAGKSSSVILASDPDREGEAIAWHLADLLGIDPASACRVRFYEITPAAVREAIGTPDRIDMDKVDAQQARRILDRLVGYTLSPLLWNKIRYGLSAGRVQSVALALICEREEEISAFVPTEYWNVTASAEADGGRRYSLRADSLDGKSLWKEGKSLLIPDAETASFVEDEIRSAAITVRSYVTRASVRKPLAPFKTSTLQQEASRRLGFSPRRTMGIAQSLFEGVTIPGRGPTGLITYMRTDSLRTAPEAIAAVREYVGSRYGAMYLPEEPNRFESKVLSQDAHEAIRPTDVGIDPSSLEGVVEPEQLRLYSMIWKRFVASQMAPAVVENATLDADAGRVGLRQLGESMRFDGWSAVWPLDLKGELLKPATPGEPLALLDVEKEQRWTKPPARYSEASLIKVLEEEGVGRPSTYASIVETLYDRVYVERNEEKRLQPTPLGMTVTEFLKRYFGGGSTSPIVDTGFTASMEESLDEVEGARRRWLDVVRSFWDPFLKTVESAKAAPRVPLPEPEPVGRDCPECGKPLIRKRGRFGEFIACTGYPECRHTEPIRQTTGVACPKCGATEGGEIVRRKSRKGRTFYGCSRYPDCDYVSWKAPEKPKCPKCGGATDGTTCADCGHILGTGNDA
jgi:DNA topoisomerase-1